MGNKREKKIISLDIHSNYNIKIFILKFYKKKKK